MKTLRLLWLAVMMAFACAKDASGPKTPAGLDPIVLVRNSAGPIDLELTWFDQSGQVSTTVIGIGQTACVKFLATLPTDSVRFIAAMGVSSLDTLRGAEGTKYHKTWSPWFNPLTGLPTARADQYPFGAEFWTLNVPTGWALIMQAVEKPPCA